MMPTPKDVRWVERGASAQWVVDWPKDEDTLVPSAGARPFADKRFIVHEVKRDRAGGRCVYGEFEPTDAYDWTVEAWAIRSDFEAMKIGDMITPTCQVTGKACGLLWGIFIHAGEKPCAQSSTTKSTRGKST